MGKSSKMEQDLQLLTTNYDSAVVSSKLSSVYCNSRRNKNHIQLLSQNADLFKRLARVHGLPNEIIEGVLKLLQKSNHVVSHSIKLTLAQAIKYSVRNQGSVGKSVSITEFVRALKKNQLEDQVNTELAFSLAHLIEHEDESSLASHNLKGIQNCLKNVSPEARELLLSQLKKVKSLTLNSTYGQIQNCKARHNLTNVKAHTVCNTTRSVKSYTERNSKSEKLEIEILSMLKAFQSRKNRIEQSFHTETLPAAITSQGGETRWYEDTYQSVKRIHERVVHLHQPISDSLKDHYLVGKLIGHQYYVFSGWFVSSRDEMFSETTKMIAEIFSLISEKQTLTPRATKAILNSLTDFSRIKDHGKQLQIKQFLIKAAYNSLHRNPESVSQGILQKIDPYIDHADKEMCHWAFKIKFLFRDKDDNYSKMFGIAISNLQLSEDIQNSTVYINTQIANQTRCEELFTPLILYKIANLAISKLCPPEQPTVSLRCVEILNNYLEQEFTKELHPATCDVLANCLTDIRPMNELKSEILKCIFLTSQKQENNKGSKSIKLQQTKTFLQPVISCIVHSIEDSDSHISNFALIVLNSISKTQEISVDSKISKKLLSQVVMSENENEIYFDQDCKVESKVTAISALAGEIILRYVSRGRGCGELTLEHLSESLCTSTDKQTKILVSECLYHISLTQILSDKLLSRLKERIEDPIADVRIYCTVAFLKGLQRKREVVYHNNFNSIPELFAFDSVKLDDKDFTHMINTAILNIIYHNLSCFGPESSKSENIFTLIGSILMNESDYHAKIKFILTAYEECKLRIVNDNEDKAARYSIPNTLNLTTTLLHSILNPAPVPQNLFVDFINKIFPCQDCTIRDTISFLVRQLSNSVLHLQKLDVLFQTLHFQSFAIEALTKYSECTGNLLPSETIFALENSLGEENLQSNASRALENVIRNGQCVSEKTIQPFIDDLFYNNDAVKRNKSAKILKVVESNQDLSDKNFLIVEMERAGFIAYIGRCANNRKMALNFLRKCIRDGNRLSLSNFEVIHKSLSNLGSNAHISLSILKFASENRQNIPDNIICTLVSNFSVLLTVPRLSMYIDFFFLVMQNNQILPDGLEEILCHILEKNSKDLMVVKKVFLIFQLKAQRGQILSEKTSLVLIHRFLDMANDIDSINTEVISLILKLIRGNVTKLVCNGLVSLFVSLLKSENKLIAKLSLHGLDYLCESNSSILTTNLISEIIEGSSNLELDKESEIMVSRILDSYNLTTDQTIKRNLSKLNNVPDIGFLLELKKLQHIPTDPFPENIYNRLNRLLEANFNVDCNMEILYLISTKDVIPEETLEIITQIYSHPEDETIGKLCETLIKKAASSGKLVSGKIITACQDNIEILKLISKNQPLDDLLQNKIRVSDNLNSKGCQFSFDHINQAISNHNFTGEILKQIMVTVDSLPTDDLNLMKRYGDIFALVLKEEHCLSNDVCSILEEKFEKISVHLEKCIFHRYAPKELLDSYFILVRRGRLEKSIIGALTGLIHSDDCFERTLSMLKCIVELANICPLREEMLCLLTNNLKSENSVIRKLSFKGMRTMQEKHSLISTEFQEFCEQLTRNINALMKTTDESVIKSDLDLLENVISLDYSNFKMLIHIPSQGWTTILLLTDILARLAVDKSEKFQFYYCWKEVEEFYNRNDSIPQCIQVLQMLREIVAEQGSKVKFLDIIETFSALKSLHPTDTLQILSKFQKNCLQPLKQRWFYDLISSKLTPELKNRTNESYKLNLASTMANSYSSTSALELMSSLKCIDDTRLFSNILNKMMDSQNYTLQLNKGDSLTLQEINLHLNKKYLMSMLTKEGYTNNADTENILTKIITAGTSFEVLKSFFTSFAPEKSKQNSFDLSKILKIVNDYNIMDPVDFSRFMQQLKSGNPVDLIYTANQLVVKAFVNSEKQRHLEELITVFKQNNIQILCLFEEHNLLQLVEKVKKPDLRSISRKISEEDGIISHLSTRHIKSWAKYVKTKGNIFKSDIEFRVEALGVIATAIKLVKKFELTDVQILSCLLALLAKRKDKGLLQQVVTGGGKSAIISVLSVVYALEGKNVDIVTSNPVLAQRDSKESQSIFELFELSTSDNSDKSIYICGPKNCYKKNVVYGDTSQYQFDILRNNYSNLGTLCGRKTDIVLVDEVDSMLIDDSSKIARLSSTAAGIDQLQIIYHLLWSWMLSLDERILFLNKIPYIVFGKLKHTEIGIELEFSSDGGDILKIPDLEMYITTGNDLNGICKPINQNFNEFLVNHLQNLLKVRLLDITVEGYEISLNEKIQIPTNLKDFVEQQIPKWVDNVVNAFNMEENVHYVLADGIVKPVDFDSTGIIQSSTTWSDGLHQFLQIKHNLKMTSENFTTNFLSNMCFFKMYGSNILGFTGTLGSVKAKEILCKVYNVDTMIIPEPYRKQYIQLPDICASSKEEWLSEIRESVYHECKKKRGVLVICEAIKDAEAVAQKLRKGKKRVKIKLYTMNNMNQENRIERISPEEIIVATNLAGRGTDVKADDIEQYGGLHICLTFLPSNQRVEHQAFGRTSRQGKCGTGQLIFMSTITTNGTVSYRTCRDEIESKALNQFQNAELKSIQIKDTLFQQFCSLLRHIRNKLEKKRSYLRHLYDGVVKVFTSSDQAVYEKCIISAIEERWAMFLNKVDTNIVSIENAEKEFESFELSVLGDFDSDEVVRSPFYYTVIANDLLRKRKYSAAKEFYNKAIELDKKFSAAAYMGIAACRLYDSPVEEDGKCCKVLALRDFKRALKILADESGNLTSIQAIIQHRTNNHLHGDLSKQVLEKLNLLGLCLNNIQHAQSVVKKSLRLISVNSSTCQIVKSTRQKRNEYAAGPQVTHYGMTEEESLLQLNKLKGDNFASFEVTFDDLTVSNDCGTKDQAMETISSAEKLIRPLENYTGINIIANDIKPDIPYILMNPDKEFFDRSAEEALNTLMCEESILQKVRLQSREVELQINFNSGKTTVYIGSIRKATKIVKEGPTSKYNIKFKNCNKKVSDLFKNVHLEVIVVDINSETAKELINASECKSYTLHIIGPSEELQKALEDPDIKMIKIINADHKNKKETSEVIPREFALDKIQKNEIKLIILQDLTKESAIEILNNCSSCQFALQLDELSIKSALSVGRLCTSNIDFYIKNLSIEKAKKLIPALRSTNIDFRLAFGILSVMEACGVISNASRKSCEVQMRQMKELVDSFLSEGRPIIELREFGDRGLEFLLQFNERESVPWLSILSLCGIAMVQMAIGGILISTGFGATAGMALSTEGAADLFYSYRVHATREFNWSDYAKMKAVSLIISACSVGWSGIKNAGTGIKTLLQEGARESMEQAATQLLINSKPVVGSVIKTGRSLNHLAWKHATVSVARVVGRECLRATTYNFSNFMINQVRPTISENIQQQIVRTLSSDLNLIVRKIYSMDLIYRTNILEEKFCQIINSILQDNTNNPLFKNAAEIVGRLIFSKLRVSVKVSNILPLLNTSIRGAIEIACIANKVSRELRIKLTEYDDSQLNLTQLLSKYCGVQETECPGLIQQLSPLSVLLSERDQSINLGVHQNYYVAISRFFKTLSDKMAQVDLNDVSINVLVKSMCDQVTDRVMGILEFEIISPWSNYGFSLAVESAQWLQHNFVLNETDNTEEFKKDQERVKSLRDRQCQGLQLSEEENNFIQANELQNSYNTVENQIKYNAKEYTTSYSQLAILKAMQTDKVDYTSRSQVSTLIQDFAKDINNGKPAGLTEMFHIAKVHGIEMKIVDDSNYLPSDYDKARRVNVVVFTKGKTSKKEGNSIGSYTLLDSTGVPKHIKTNKLNYTGYEILEHLTEKSTNTLRSEISLEMATNPQAFHKAIEAEALVDLYHPQESNSHLFRA